MPLTGNAIDNNTLASLANRAGPEVTSAIQNASLKTGVNFAYLMQKADTESSFDTDAGSKTSSAKGLYQFIGSTWMQMVKRYGDKYGLGAYADKISDNGKVADPKARKEILALRDDPQISSLMAGEFAAENKQSLINSGIKEKDIGSTELYLAHFMGAGAASEFIKDMKKNPLTPAADIFPAAARANHNVFYTKTQHERSLGEVYALFDKKFSGSDGSIKQPAQNNTAVASNAASPNEQPAETYYASNSILRTLPMAEDSTDTDNSGDTALNSLYSTQHASTLPAARNSLVANTATLMALANSHQWQSTHTYQSRSASNTVHESDRDRYHRLRNVVTTPNE